MDLRIRGFQLVGGDSVNWVGPDANVALSEGFLATHCFRVVRSRGLLGRRRLGLAFAPLDTTRATFLRGTMWLEESSSRLDAVEYTYAVPSWPRRVAVPRGMIRFAVLPGGGWIVREWELWVPILDRPTLSVPLGTTVRHVATLEKRGRARVLAKATDVPMPPAFLYGAVFDSVAGQPLTGAALRVLGRDAAVLDSAGAFAVRIDRLGEDGALLPVEVRHPMLARYGVPLLEQTLSVIPGDSLPVTFALPSVDSILARACPVLASPRSDVAWGTTSLGALFVEISRAPGDTSRLHARAEWEWEEAGEPKVTWAEDSVDAGGTYVACPVATDLPVTLTLTDAGGTRLRRVIPPVGRRARRVVAEVPPGE